MSVILFYSPFDQRSRDTETLMIAFRKQGHRVISLSQASGDKIHYYLRQHDIETYSHVLDGKAGVFYYLRHLLHFVAFCRRQKVNIVYSHLEPANIVASIGQFLVRAKVFIVRHHIDEARLERFDRSLSYRLTYMLAKRVIVVSQQAKRYMTDVEKVDPEKIVHINLAYDFGLYPKPDPGVVASIRDDNYVTLLAACRFTKFKRPRVAVEVLSELRRAGINARLILLGRGEEEEEIRKMIGTLGLAAHVQLPGYVNNVTDFMAASDFLGHPSVSESSCVIVKEAALTHLPVIVCKGIGDFDDYIEHEKNGFLVIKDNFATEASGIVSRYMSRSKHAITESLYKTVTGIFGVENIIRQYEPLNH